MDTVAPNPILDDVLARLRAHEADLRAKGVRHAAVFGSVARGEAGPESDVDIMVDLDRDKVRSLFEYAGIAGDLQDIVGRDVDVAMRDRLKEFVRPSALRDAVDVF